MTFLDTYQYFQTTQKSKQNSAPCITRKLPRQIVDKDAAMDIDNKGKGKEKEKVIEEQSTNTASTSTTFQIIYLNRHLYPYFRRA